MMLLSEVAYVECLWQPCDGRSALLHATDHGTPCRRRASALGDREFVTAVRAWAPDLTYRTGPIAHWLCLMLDSGLPGWPRATSSGDLALGIVARGHA